MRYIACEGQVNMADIGYSPLPPNLSQEVANSIGRMNGTAPEILTRENCANPRFDPNYLAPGSPEDPLVAAGVINESGDSTGDADALRRVAAVGSEDSQQPPRRETPRRKSAGGGSGHSREADPVAYDRPG